MKGIILAGGSGTRLYPLTIASSKQLMPVYDKPMIYYPLSILMLLGIKDILIISTNEDTPRFQKLLGDGKNLGMNFSYEVQHEPKGLAEAFLIGEDFIGNDSVSLILGDNLFHGSGYLESIRTAIQNIEGGLIFGYKVKNPKDYGVVEFDKFENKNSLVKSLEEKPLNPKSNYAVPGLYFYDNDVIKLTKELKPSNTGTHRSLLRASNYVESLESRQGVKISCIEEIALHKGYINKKQLIDYISLYPNNEYSKYLKKLIK